MAMNGLVNLAGILETGRNEVVIDPDVANRAKRSIQRMLDFAKGLDLAAAPARNEPGSENGIGPA